jgi:hypothetical protein
MRSNDPQHHGASFLAEKHDFIGSQSNRSAAHWFQTTMEILLTPGGILIYAKRLREWAHECLKIVREVFILFWFVYFSLASSALHLSLDFLLTQKTYFRSPLATLQRSVEADITYDPPTFWDCCGYAHRAGIWNIQHGSATINFKRCSWSRVRKPYLKLK